MMAVRCVSVALPLLLGLGDIAWAKRGQRGMALPSGDAGVPALDRAELQWCVTQENRIDQEQPGVDTTAAALRGQAAQIQQAREELLRAEADARMDCQMGIRSMRGSIAEMRRRDLQEREETLARDSTRSRERATGLAGMISEYDDRCAGHSYRESDLRALPGRVGR